MSKHYHVDFAAAIAPTIAADNARGWDYAPKLQDLDRPNISGVYCILQRGQLVYVGESHTGRLFDTLTRHFRAWKSPGYTQGRRSGGTTYDRFAVSVLWIKTPAKDAADLQFELIQRLNPRDNIVDGSTVLDNLPV